MDLPLRLALLAADCDVVDRVGDQVLTASVRPGWLAPPAALIAQAVRAASTNVWETQSINARREQLLHFDGTTNSGTGTSSPPLTWATATKQTARGEVALSWELGNGTLSMEVSVPANTVASTVVPFVGGGASPTIVEGG
eukprot:COSAG02_NODE_4092_length_5795_cov_4.106390_3_plen_139_part_01